MTHEMAMIEDGIVRMAFIGEVDDQAAESWYREFMPFLEATTAKRPISLLVDASRDDKMSGGARRTLAQVQADPRLAKVAIVKINRFNRVMITFLSKVTGRDNMGLFDTEAEALAWLKEG